MTQLPSPEDVAREIKTRNACTECAEDIAAAIRAYGLAVVDAAEAKVAMCNTAISCRHALRDLRREIEG